MTVTAAQVKELRDMTGAGMMDAKKALVETGGNVENAVDWLRKKGMAKAEKKAGRAAAEGAVLAKTAGNKAAMVEVNSETDFAAKNNKFQEFSNTVLEIVLNSGESDVEAIKGMDYGNGKTVGEQQVELVATIGENIGLRRAAFVEEANGTVGAYVHMGGKIGVLVGLSEAGQDDVAKQVAMHIAASNPQFLNRDSIEADVLAREEKVYTERAEASGKPAQVVEKIVQGQLNKFCEEICLVDQAFVMDTDRKVGEVVQGEISSFTRLGLGEGVEKKEEDFAAEVAATMAG